MSSVSHVEVVLKRSKVHLHLQVNAMCQSFLRYPIMDRLVVSLNRDWTPTIYLHRNGWDIDPSHQFCIFIGPSSQPLGCWLARPLEEVKQEGLQESWFPLYVIWQSVTIDGSLSAQVNAFFNNVSLMQWHVFSRMCFGSRPCDSQRVSLWRWWVTGGENWINPLIWVNNVNAGAPSDWRSKRENKKAK